MSYIEEFQFLLESEQLSQFLRLWEEYCLSDEVDGAELAKILQMIKDSSMAKPFGQLAESAIPMWEKIEDPQAKEKVISLILDLQTTNTPRLADYAFQFLKERYPNDKDFNEKARLIGLRSRTHFQGAISNFKLLSHMKKGSFVFHTGGWGVGEVMDFSMLREHVVLEFEGITAFKDVSFENAFKNLIPLDKEHFLARRFGNPDSLEKDAKEDPGKVIKLLLKDLGPKTAAEIKDELSDLVIPEEDWAKWWQLARAKIKKDTFIKSPSSTKEPFSLMEEEVSHVSRFLEALKKVVGINDLILVVYNYTRDFVEVGKSEEAKKEVKTLLEEGLQTLEKQPVDAETQAKKMEIAFLLEDLFPKEYGKLPETTLSASQNLEDIVEKIEIVAFKKRMLTLIKSQRAEWVTIFLNLFLTISQNPLRDSIFKDLLADSVGNPLVHEKIQDLLSKVCLYPEPFLWYFQKIANEEDVPYSDSHHKKLFLEAFMILFHYVEMKSELKDLVKKMHQMLTAKRYLVVRNIIKDADIAYLSELLLLASKCHTVSQHDLRILHSLAEVVHPVLGQHKKDKQQRERDMDTLWTTEEGYLKLQETIKHIGTVEIVDNAREIEAARALGDLRENSEYKFALERRNRLQADLRNLTKQIQKARVLRKEDITTSEVSVGVTVDLADKGGKKISYTILGPWDADTERNILSFQSKFAQAMIGKKVGETFAFQNEEFTVKEIRSFL